MAQSVAGPLDRSRDLLGESAMRQCLENRRTYAASVIRLWGLSCICRSFFYGQLPSEPLPPCQNLIESDKDSRSASTGALELQTSRHRTLEPRSPDSLLVTLN